MRLGVSSRSRAPRRAWWACRAGVGGASPGGSRGLRPEDARRHRLSRGLKGAQPERRPPIVGNSNSRACLPWWKLSAGWRHAKLQPAESSRLLQFGNSSATCNGLPSFPASPRRSLSTGCSAHFAAPPAIVCYFSLVIESPKGPPPSELARNFRSP